MTTKDSALAFVGQIMTAYKAAEKAGASALEAALECGSYLNRVRFSRPPTSQRPHQIHPLVAVPLSRRWHRHRLGHVPILPLKPFAHIHSPNELTVFFSGCYRHKVSRGSSVVEQPIRNRQVVGSTPTLGSILFSPQPFYLQCNLTNPFWAV